MLTPLTTHSKTNTKTLNPSRIKFLMVRVMQVIEAVYENGVLKTLKKLKLKEHSKVIIKIIDEEELDKLLSSMVIEKIENIDYKKLKEAYYESL